MKKREINMMNEALKFKSENSKSTPALDDKPTAIEDSMDIAYNLAIDHVLEMVGRVPLHWADSSEQHREKITKSIQTLKKQ